MKIAWFKHVISPEVGAYMAGYSLVDKSVAKLDDLYMTGLCIDDGQSKVLLVSLDLIGLDAIFLRELRKIAMDALHIPESAALLSCTHNHTGPECRLIAGHPEQLNKKYLEDLKTWFAEAVSSLTCWKDCKVTFYSSRCDENRNRRYVTADNHASFTAHRREVVPQALEYADKELGELIFYSTENREPLYVIGNYAAHPLAGHAPGRGGKRISADFPGAFREYVTSETGAECMFISGAAGDLVPREDELGADASRQMGIRLAKAAIGGVVDSIRNPNRFVLNEPRVASSISKFVAPLRPHCRNNARMLGPEYLGKDNVELEIQCIAIGDICFVGVPGELCCELGQEIKWHSPFRRTFIAYNATDYFDYIGHANMLVAGGYEGFCQRISARSGLTLVKTASDAMFDLRETLFPSEGAPYPDANRSKLVDIPVN